MANEEHLKILGKGVEEWNLWRKHNPEEIPNLRNAHLGDADIRNANLSGTDLRGVILSYADLSCANLSSADLRGANLSGTSLRSSNLKSADLSGADLRGASLTKANLSSADLSTANLRGADLQGANLLLANLSSVNLKHTNLRGADLTGVHLVHTNIRGVNFTSVNLSGVNLSSADLTGMTFSGVNFSHANLSATNLRFTNFNGINLSHANLSHADLSHANLSYADLGHANLSYAFGLNTVDLRLTNLHGTNLSHINLSGADLRGVNLSHTCLYAAQVLACDFAKAILTGSCIEDWQIGRSTKLDGVICDYIFRQRSPDGRFTQRLPASPDKIFAKGEFEQWAKVRATALDTIDLTFTDGIDWQSLFSTLQQVRHQHPDSGVRMQAVEENGGAYVVRLRVETEATGEALEQLKAKIETQTKTLYENRLVEAYGEIKGLKYSLETILRSTSMASNTYNNHIQGSVGSIGGDNYGTMNAYIGANINEIQNLLSTLRQSAQAFPDEQKEEARIELDDLEKDLTGSNPPDQKRVNHRLKRLAAIGATVLTLAGGAAAFSEDANKFMGNVTEMREKVEVIMGGDTQQQPGLPSAETP